VPDDFYKKLLDSLSEGVYFVDLDRRITYWNRGAERLTEYAADEVLGRKCRDNILVHTDPTGCLLCQCDTCPAAIAMQSGQPIEGRVFLRHKKGHRVPIHVRVEPIRNETGEVVGAVETFHDDSASVAATEQIASLSEAALLDSLTEIGNRRFCELELRRRCDEWSRLGWPFGVVFVDIDHFKLVNDTWGHDNGDKVLRMVAKTLANTVRSFDVVGRWGGEEFLVQLKNVGPCELAHVAERCRRLVQGSALQVGQGLLQVTVSAGATLIDEGDTPSSLVRRADALMYRAKEAGRNQVVTG
jgi:diguanylate cyclase (GGDEF)-like protein/PAS domain S-box-containing protein